MITYRIAGYMPYIFLIVFLIIYFAILISAFIDKKRVASTNPNRAETKPLPFLHKILVSVLLISFPLCVVSAILLQDIVMSLICAAAFAFSIFVLIVTASKSKITLTVMKNGKKEVVEYTMKEYQRNILNGTLDVNSIIEEQRSGYTKPESNYNDDPFSKFD